MTRVGPEWFWQICRFRAEAWGKSFPQKSTPASTFCLLYHFVLDIVEYDMISSTSHQAWLFYSPLALQASLLKDDLLDPVDTLLGRSGVVGLGRPMSGHTFSRFR